jgi:serine/threonine-protein kinase HipA
VPDDLAVWLHGDHVATVVLVRGRPRLSYTETALVKYPLGLPLLSLALPLTPQPFTPGVVGPFLDGLLPEEDARRAIADDFNVRASDTYGLIRALGRDCAGALVIQPADEPAPSPPSIATAERLNDDEIGELVANLRSAPLGVGGRVRISLAGMQEKLLLTKMSDGSWGRPVDGTPSTHILKPSIARYPDTVLNEAFAMRVAKHLGLSVANVETTRVDGRDLIVVERFDRVVHHDGTVERLHQEDFCQATGTPPVKKYQEDGGPSLRRIARILRDNGTSESPETLLRAVVLNVLIGNGDAHAKNFSLLHHPVGTLQLTPIYDVMSTLYYGDDQLAMSIDNAYRTNRVTANQIVNEAVSWGIPKVRAVAVVADMLDRALAAIQVAEEETTDLPAEIVKLARSQLHRLEGEFDMAPGDAHL